MGARYIQNVFSNSIMIDKILTTHTKINGQVEISVIYSKCKTYRYSLTKDWNKKGKRLLFILLNPSTATEKQNDPTIERCERRSRLMNYGAFRVCNLFAFRTKSPKIMKNQKDPIGPHNDKIISQSIMWADDILCAWGIHGKYLNRSLKLESLLKSQNYQIFHLGLTKDKSPRHPLYITYKKAFERWL